MKFRKLVLFAFFLTAAFMLSGCVVAAEHLSKAKIEVNPAPEMRGAGENFTSGYKYRFSGGVNAAPSTTQKIHGIYNEWADWCGTKCRDLLSEHNASSKVNLEYEFEYSYVNGSAEVLGSAGPLLWSLGLGFNSGVYGFASLGLNTKHFEIGVSAGVWNNFRDYEYEGIEYESLLGLLPDVYDVAGTSHSAGTSLLGLYTSLYFGSISLEVSASMYDVDLENKRLSREPTIFTMYTTVGYRLDEHWSVRAGAVNLQGSGVEDMVWSGFAGVSYLL